MLEKAALETLAPQELETYGLGKWSTDYPGLREVLERTREIKMEHADVFFPLKSTNTEVRIERGTELKTAIIEGNGKLIGEIAPGIAEGDARTATADLLLDLLDRTSAGPFLRNAISAALELYCLDGFFSPSERVRVGRGLLRALIYKDKAGVLSQTPGGLLQCASEAAGDYLARVLDEYYRELEKVALPENLVGIVMALYKFSPDRPRFAALLNGRFEAWSDSREGLSALDQLSELSKLPKDEKIPGANVVARVLSAFSTSELGEFGIARRKLLFTNWSENIADPFVRVLVSKLQGQSSEDGYSPVVKFVISSILLQPQLVESDSSGELWALLPPLFENLTDAEGKKAVTRAAILFAVRSQDAEISAQSREFVLQAWRNLTDPFLREDLEFIKSMGTPQSQQLLKQGVEQELDSIRNEIQRPTDRTVQRVALCFDHRDILEAGSLEDTLVKAMDSKPAETLKTWLRIIEQRQAALEQDLPGRFAFRCLEIMPSISGSEDRQELLLQAFVTVFPRLSPDERRSSLHKYFALMKDPHPNTRSVAAFNLKELREAASDSQDFKLAVANVIKYLRDEIRTSELPEYQDVFDALLTLPGLLGEYQNRDLANMAKTLMSQAEGSVQELGLRIVERMPAIPSDDQAEVIHLLIDIARSSADLKQRAADRLGQLAVDNVADDARSELEGWRKRAAEGLEER